MRASGGRWGVKIALRPLPGIRGGSRGGKPANRAECTFIHKRNDKRSCNGAFGKTSGRSIFPNAPLRATSSATRRSMSDAISNILSTCIYRTPGRVGFARRGKLLLNITNISTIECCNPSRTRLYADQSSDDPRLGRSVPVLLCRFWDVNQSL